ncbi:MAG: disulfide bond formation protein B [Aquificaceae bacterium]|nr:MAG: disulfide bond formation protein B [Aquificaceae bacterium]
MSIRPTFLISFTITVVIMATALFFQYGLGLEPCPLCILQRIIVMTLSAIFLVGLLHNPKPSLVRRLYGQIVATTSLAGLAIAGRHIWLQHLPKDQAPECGAGLDYWIKTLPPNEVIEKIFEGTGECSEVVWSFASFSIPEWSLIVFTGFFLYGMKLLIKGH